MSKGRNKKMFADTGAYRSSMAFEKFLENKITENESNFLNEMQELIQKNREKIKELHNQQFDKISFYWQYL